MSKLPDTNKYKNRIDIIKLVINQLEKDLGIKHSISFSQNPDTAYDELFHQTVEILKIQVMEEGKDLKQLLYQIDVSEKQLLEAMHSGKFSSELDLYSHLILERELQKVVTRLYFSNKLSS